MKISEIFTSIQGEGPELGKPTVFVRVTGCNLRCDFCDTKYAFNKGKSFSAKRLALKLKSSKIKHITWTGGEPALQYETIREVVKLLGPKFKHSIETNGTILFNPQPFDIVIISPKKDMIRPAVIRGLFASIEKTYLKFVAKDKKEFVYWWDFIEDEKLYKRRDHIYFMAEGTDNYTLLKRSRIIVELCKQKRINFSPRTHVWLWGNKKGV